MIALLEWFGANARDLPWRGTRDPYAIWISEVMLQQTQVKTVIPYWRRWMKELPAVRDLAGADLDTVHRLWAGLGYYTRARNLHRAAQAVETVHEGRLPGSVEELLSLPGIGRYTAGAIASIAWNQPAPILDGNVTRVLTRVLGISSNPAKREVNAKLWETAGALVRRAGASAGNGEGSAPVHSHLNQALMELGALVCLPRAQARCDMCPLARLCVARRTHRVATIPALAPRVAVEQRLFAAFLVRNKGRFLLRQIPAGKVNAHLWEFPSVELSPNAEGPPSQEQIMSGLKLKLAGTTPVCTLKHSITRYRITLRAYSAVAEPRSRRDEKWLSAAQINTLALTSAHRKVWIKWCAAMAADIPSEAP